MNEAVKILDATQQGLEVFLHYLGESCLSRCFRNPYREDSRPSCHLYLNKTYSKGLYYLQDFGDSSYCGNCFCFVAKLNHLNVQQDFREVLQIIDNDLSLGIFNIPSNHRTLLKPIKQKIKYPSPAQYIDFHFTKKDFSSFELKYWKHYGIDINTLSQYKVISLASFDMKYNNGRQFEILSSPTIPMYGYLFNDCKGLKIYRPKAKTRFLYAGLLPKPYIFGWSQLHTIISHRIIITGGEKDVMSLAAHGFPAIAFNSETANIPEKYLSQLQKTYDEIIFLYDTDKTGRQESQRQVELYRKDFNVRKVDLPLPGIKKCKDISDFFACGHSSVELNKLLEKAYV